MTLIAAVADDSGVTIASDTKITFDDDALASARVFTLALPKIVLLRDDVAVAISGKRPTELVRQLTDRRDQDLTEIVEHLRSVPDAGFIVAALGGRSIWTVSDGEVRSVATGELALEGDPASFSDFRTLHSDFLAATTSRNALVMAMDRMAGPLGRHASVGGFNLAATTKEGAFRFASRPTTIAPRAEETAQIFTDEHSHLHIRVSLPVGNSQWYQTLVLAGRGATPGAVGIYVEQAKCGRLFAHERPYESISLEARTARDFVHRALEHGQELELISGPLPTL